MVATADEALPQASLVLPFVRSGDTGGYGEQPACAMPTGSAERSGHVTGHSIIGFGNQWTYPHEPVAMDSIATGFTNGLVAHLQSLPRVVFLPLSFREGRVADSDWSELMAAAQLGNAAVYHRLLLEVSAWLRLYYVRRLPPSMVADTVQDTLLAIHEKRHTYDPSRPFGPWLAAIARYKWIDRLRAMKAGATEALSEDTPVAGHEEAVTTARSLEVLLRQLKPAQSRVIRLVKIEGLSIEEAAARTGQSISLVKVNIHRGLNRLASMVQHKSDVE